MGLFDAITGKVVMEYKVKTDEAKAKIKELSGEQKKAAKEAAEGMEKQGKAAESMAGQYAKGAAIIVAGFMAARDGLAAMQKETRLSAGAAGVDIDALSDSWDGLKSRMDLLTLAQAGHRGAWKLTTGQIQLVTEGMRALEAKGYETEKVFDKFTEVMKKGKLEGLDEFGLSVKATGNQADDLRVLMRALGQEVADVGGNFDKAGDAAQRSITKMEDSLTRLRVTIGQTTNAVLGFMESFGEGWGQAIFGNLPEERGTAGRGDMYARQFQSLRGGSTINRQHQGISGSRSGLVQQRWGLFASASDADKQAGEALSKFKSSINRGVFDSSTPEQLAAAVAGLPEEWREVDEILSKRVDDLSVSVQKRFEDNFGKIGANVAERFANAFNTNAAEVAAARKKKGAAAAGKFKRSFVDRLGDGVDALVGLGTVMEDRRQEALAADAANQNAAADRARQDEVAQQRWAASMEQSRRWSAEMAQTAEEAARSREQTFLESTFGKIEEFDRYGAAFSTLKGAVTSGFNAWITGAESVGTAVRRSIAQSLGGYAIEMAGMALVAAAHGVYHLTNPLTAAQGAGELLSAAKYTAAAVALGGLAKLASPAGNSAPSTGGSATGGRSGRNQDHRGQGGGGDYGVGARQTVVILGSDYGDDSRRVRDRNAYAAFARTSTVYVPPRGVAA